MVKLTIFAIGNKNIQLPIFYDTRFKCIRSRSHYRAITIHNASYSSILLLCCQIGNKNILDIIVKHDYRILYDIIHDVRFIIQLENYEITQILFEYHHIYCISNFIEAFTDRIIFLDPKDLYYIFVKELIQNAKITK